MIKKKARKQKENAHTILLKRKLYETSTFVKARTKIKKWGAQEYFCLESCKYKGMGQCRKIFINASQKARKVSLSTILEVYDG